MSLRKVLKPFLRSRHYRGSIRIAIYADELAAWGERSRREGRIFFSYYDPFKPGREASWWLDLWFQKSLEKSQPRQTCFHSQKPGSLEEGDYNFFVFLIFFGLEAGTTQILAKGRLLVLFDVTAVHHDARVWHIRPQYWNHLLLIDRLHWCRF